MNTHDLEQKGRMAETLRAELQAVSDVADAIDDNFLAAIELLAERRGKIITMGVGKSGFIAMKAAATLTSLGHEAFFLSPLDALHGDSGIIRPHDVLIMFSFSGSSPEIVKLIKHVRTHIPVHVIAITGNAESSLAQLSDRAITFKIEQEGCPLGLAPMASTTASLVIADCIAAALTSPEEFSHAHFAQFHPAGSLGLSLKKVHEVMAGGEHLPVVSENAILNDALIEITLKKRGVVGVVETTSRLLGIITDGDLRRIILNYENPKGEPVTSVMTREPKIVRADDTLKHALTLMEKHRIMNVFVVDSEDVLVGLVHMHDILGDALTPH